VLGIANRSMSCAARSPSRLVQRAFNEYEVDSVFHSRQAMVGVANRSPLSTFEPTSWHWSVLEAAGSRH